MTGPSFQLLWIHRDPSSCTRDIVCACFPERVCSVTCLIRSEVRLPRITATSIFWSSSSAFTCSIKWVRKNPKQVVSIDCKGSFSIRYESILLHLKWIDKQPLIFIDNVPTIIIYGAEMWKFTLGDIELMDDFHKNCARIILGIFWRHASSNMICVKELDRIPSWKMWRLGNRSVMSWGESKTITAKVLSPGPWKVREGTAY